VVCEGFVLDGVLVLGDLKIDRGRLDGRMPEPNPGSSNLAPGFTIKKVIVNRVLKITT
jgi:hypothetical protein